MKSELIGFIQTRMTTPRWHNGKAGMFEYILERCAYRFIETSQNLNYYLIAERLRNDENTPIVIKGFVAFLIACWGQDEVAIYNTYNERKKNAFLEIEAKKPGSFKRDLDKEFAKQLLGTEQNNFEEFVTHFDYISDVEKSLIIEYVKNYLEYTSSIYKQKLKKVKIEKTFESLLHHDRKTALMDELHDLLDGTQGKKVAIVVKSLCKLGYLDLPSNRNELYRTMETAFGNIGTASNLNIYLNPDRMRLLDPELEPTIEILKRV